MKIVHVNLGTEFTTHLGPRRRILGPYSGEDLFELLLPKYQESDLLVVELDGIEGYTPSCLDQAFGGLVLQFSLAGVQEKIRFNAVKNAFLVPMIEAWMREAETKRRSKSHRQM